VTLPSLSVVVVAYESAAALPACLDALRKIPSLEVVVVDNASTDGGERLARERGATILRNGRNEGFGPAANLGAEASRGEILCFLNPDCLVDADLIEAGVAALAREPGACAVPDLLEGAQIVPGRQPGYTRVKLLADVLEAGRLTRWMASALRSRPGIHDRSWAWPHGACFFVRRDRFLAAGGFDPRYFLYMEDVDFGRRLTAAGGTVVSLGRTVVHAGSGGARIDPDLRQRLLLAGRVLYARERYGPFFAGTLRLLGRLVTGPGTLARAVR
jgi:GT2 family glycosyltransferase